MRCKKTNGEGMAVAQKHKDQLLEIIQKHVPKCKIYLSGSRATNTEKPGSDIDVALDAGSPIPPQKILKMLVDLDETTIPVKVDIVDLQTASQELKNDVFSEGILWKK